MDRFTIYFNYVDNNSKYYVKKGINDKDVEIFTVTLPKEGWDINPEGENPVWTIYTKPNIEMDIQGWKIHISTIFDYARDTLNIVSPILINKGIPFKHVKNSQVLHNMYSKSGNRISSGKFITIYPRKEQFISLINELDNAICDLPKGPYILTDKQWKNGNVYYRYGAFKKIVNEQGIYCIYNKDGDLIPDERKPQYHLPDFIDELPELVDEEHNNQVIKTENKLELYSIEKALRFTNSGGIYFAKRNSDNKYCIIKEARASIGLDALNKTAKDRLQNEYNALTKLSGVSGVVNILDYFKVWENQFLVEEFIEGIPLMSWVARNYPFTIDTNILGYFEKLKKLLGNLIDTVQEMHKTGIAMCDLQTQNILVLEDLNIKLIDFEIASNVDDTSKIGMFTKGFSHPLNEKAKDRDWYALNRIFQFCFLPIGPVSDFDMTLNTKHCLWIYDTFGKEIYEFFDNFQMKCSKNIDKFKDIFKNTYNIDKNQSKLICIYKITSGLIRGLLSNCDIESDSLINGDVRQFETDCGILNLQNGGFGAVLALIKSSDSNNTKDIINKWINRIVPTLMSNKYNNGFLTGRSGIACVLYESGYTQIACEIMNTIVSDYKENTNDLTFRSGLSGIGIAMIGLYHETYKYNYLEEAKSIANILLDSILKNNSISGFDWDSVSVGLLDGFSGVSMFFSLLYSITCDEIYLENAISMLQKDIVKSKISDEDGVFQTLDAKNRLLPYLSNGSIGVGVSISVLNHVTKGNYFSNELTAICNVDNTRCCFEPNFFDGIAGFFLLNCFDSNMYNINKNLKILELFLLEEDGKTFIPGKMFYKYSSDLHSGTSGILLALHCTQTKNILNWMPILHKLTERKGNV